MKTDWQDNISTEECTLNSQDGGVFNRGVAGCVSGVWRDVARCGEVWRDVVRNGEIRRSVARCGEMW